MVLKTWQQDSTESGFRYPGMDEDSKSLNVNLWVWNTSTLAFEKMVQPSILIDADDLTVSMGDVEKLLADNYWNDVRIDTTSGNIDYIGKNTTHKAATTATSWYIWKYSDYSGGLSRRVEGPLTGSWDGRAALAWA